MKKVGCLMIVCLCVLVSMNFLINDITSLYAASVSLQDLETSISVNAENTVAVPLEIQLDPYEQIAAFNVIVEYDTSRAQWSHLTVTRNLLDGEKFIYANEPIEGRVHFIVYGFNKRSLTDGPIAYINYIPLDNSFDAINDVHIRAVTGADPLDRPLDIAFDGEPMMSSPRIINSDKEVNLPSFVLNWVDESGANNNTYEINRVQNQTRDVGSYTLSGNARILNAENKFGEGAVYFDGAGDFVSVPASDNWDFGIGDFTIDTWVWLDSLNNTFVICAQDRTSYDFGIFYFDAKNGLSFCVNEKNAMQYRFMSEGSVSRWQAKKWVHVALVRHNNVYQLFKDGVPVASMTDSTAWPQLSGDLYIGCQRWNGTEGAFFKGLIDEFRVTKGMARWGDHFVPLTEEHFNDNMTKLLLHFNGTAAQVVDNYSTKQTYLSQSNLSNGVYTYRVRARSEDGILLSPYSNDYTVTINSSL